MLKRFAKKALLVWAAFAFIMGATLMAGHWVILPAPAKEDQSVAEELLQLAQDPKRDLLAVHILYSRCKCSKRILEHLFESERPKGVEEIILLVQPDAELKERAEAAGFRVQEVSPAELKQRYHIEGAPLLGLIKTNGSLAYLGGYTARKQGPDIQDLKLIRDLRSGGSLVELPLFGCAVSLELRTLLDPLGIKYDRDN